MPARMAKWLCSMNDAVQRLLALIKANDGINDKARLARIRLRRLRVDER